MDKLAKELFNQDSTKARICREAVSLFAEKGYNGVSMRELSERTNVSKPTIYYYFGSKAGIYTALFEKILVYNTDNFLEILKSKGSYKDKIIALARLRFQQVVDYPELAKFFLVLFTQPEKLPFIEGFIDEAFKGRELLTKLIKEGINSGEFGPRANPQMAAELFIAAITHFTWKQLNSKTKILSETLAEEIVEMLFFGLNE